MLEVDIEIKAGDLYDYMLMHTYHSGSGIVGGCVGALGVIIGFSMKNWLLLLFGLFILFYLPWNLFIKSKLQYQTNPGFKKPLHYLLDDQGITVSQGEAKEHQDWNDMVKAVSTGRSIIVYTSGRNATIFPKAQLGEKKDLLIEMISTHMPPGKVKIRS